jgi:hypothetical protein
MALQTGHVFITLREVGGLVGVDGSVPRDMTRQGADPCAASVAHPQGYHDPGLVAVGVVQRGFDAEGRVRGE